MTRVWDKQLEDQGRLKNISISLFTIYFFTVGIYQFPSLKIDIDTVLLIKRLILVAALAHMILCVKWQHALIKDIVKIFAAWSLFLVFNFFIHGNFSEVLFKIAQSASVLIILCFFVQNFFYVKEFFNINYLIFPTFIFCLFIVLVSFFLFEDVYFLVSNGFGGNRVNFSIWLSQFTVLISAMWCFGSLIPFKNSRWQFLSYIVHILPVVFLQIASGGRLGLIISFITIFVSIFYKFKSFLLQIIFVFSCSAMFLVLYMFSSPQSVLKISSHSIFRGFDEFSRPRDPNLSYTDFYFNLFDLLTSFRLSLFVEGMRAFNLKIFLLGSGFGNFQVINTKGNPQQVHNVFLNSLGEIGILGFLFFCFVILFPFFHLRNSENTKAIKMGLGVWFVQAWFQPEFFYSQIGASICFWIIFAYSLRTIYEVSDNNY